MTQTFEQLGVRPDLVTAARMQGFETATALQAAAVPVLRRGGNLVLNASTGAGVTLAYALPLLDRVVSSEAASGPRMLVLVPTEDRATRKAFALGTLASAVNLRAAALAQGWRRKGDAAVIVATPQAARAAVEQSALKLDALCAFVLVDANILIGESADAITALMASIPRDAQRVVATQESTPEVERFIEAHVRKAMNVPARSEEEVPAGETPVTLDYVVVPESRKESQLVRLLEQRANARPVIVVRSTASADALGDALTARGFEIGDEGSETRIVTADEATGAGSEVSFDVPFDAEALKHVHGNGGLVLATPAELPHLRKIAAAAGITLRAERIETPSGESLSEYRRMLRQAVYDEDIAAQLAVLDPLFDEFSAAEIAATLSALLRKRVVPKSSSGGGMAMSGAPRPASAEAGFVRLFFSAGSRDNIRPGDLVGAITGESNVTGDQVGKVDIRESFTVVEIAAPVAEKVIRAMNGTTMRGRALRVDYDRKPGTAREGSREPMRSGGRDTFGGRDREPRGPRGRDGSRDSGRTGGTRGGYGGGDRPPRRDGPRRDGPRR